ncbi:hypothetical protein LT85_3831 [Collimonas arenae]|uniref:Uncharacterized protein n=1 Tax=Collimonas arenae TaxID=279058 RepID=A0A0A1FH78_9BURK|nr:hypothetical protein LT85_3831 [Collimonas arenae]
MACNTSHLAAAQFLSDLARDYASLAGLQFGQQHVGPRFKSA